MRATLWLKTQADLTDQERRMHVITLLRRLASIADDEDLDSITVTVEGVGSKARLDEAATIASKIVGTRQRIEDIPG